MAWIQPVPYAGELLDAGGMSHSRRPRPRRIRFGIPPDDLLDYAVPPERRAGRPSKRDEGGGYRRDHLRALAQGVEVADREVRIMGSKSDLLRTLAAISGVKSATGGVRNFVLVCIGLAEGVSCQHH